MTKLRYRTPMRPVQGPLANEWQSSGSNPSVRPPNSVLLPKPQNWPTQADQAWLLNLYTAPWALGRKRGGQAGPGRGWAGSSARPSGPGQDGKSGGLRSVESGEVIEGHSRGWVQAGQGSSENNQLQPGLALLCLLLQCYPWPSVLLPAAATWGCS